MKLQNFETITGSINRTIETEKAITLIKDTFPKILAEKLNLLRVTAPLIVESQTGINDDLNGVEKPVTFTSQAIGKHIEIVQSLAKWKRLALHKLKMQPGQGIYTDMNALRPDEIPDATHSIYVDQWDWEKCIDSSDRTVEYFRKTVNLIYAAIKEMEMIVATQTRAITPELPQTIHFIHTAELEEMYPSLTAKEREHRICQQYGAVCIEGIGYPLSDGKPTDGRAPDYDDWSTLRPDGYRGLNGDIIVWHKPLGIALELSSMGIRVNSESLMTQLKLQNHESRIKYPYHSMLINNILPQTIGGGIGQSRLCMYLLRKVHIAQVQESVWPDEIYGLF
ncbi:MAG: aspartate--ammonia ligase [Tenuifilum sp.]|jgi:aspartate--ammonia ligase|uniref:aspartate--ammonia ligase n=1 Tax=Tenuifilum sp. TaxID=2760880 RepID=UPI0024AC3A53|nr:aspartate--ammonia ligase [Tenuifilum sp.]MDI3526655.1 aspartate--ammonia ligase [Tenuifilum sp.]